MAARSGGLSRADCDRIRAGGAPRLTFPGDKPCPLEPGDVLPVAANLELVVDRIRRNKKDEHSIVYTIRDFRVRLPRRVPPVHAESKSHLNRYGMPPPPTAEEIKLAVLEGGVTSSKHMAVRGHDLAENVEADDYRVIELKSRERWVEHKREEQADTEAAEDLRRVKAELNELVKRAAKMGVDPMLALGPIAREIQAQHANLKDAA